MKTLPVHPMVIGGQETRAGAGVAPVTDPSWGRPFAAVAVGNDAVVDAAVNAAAHAFDSWRARPVTERSWLLQALAEVVERDRDNLVQLESANVGKLSREVDRELTTSIAQIRGFARTMTDLWPDSSASSALIDWQPLGVVASLLPWNAPLSAVCRRIAITIATANTTVIKPSTLGPMTPLRLALLASVAGVPPGVINAVTGPGPTVGRYLANHPGIAKVSFTGGQQAGDEIYRSAAQNRRPVAVEMGGKSPQIVFADAPWEDAVAGVIRGFTRNAGQICTCGTRLLVESSIAERFVADLVTRVSTMRVGPAEDPSTDMGPQIAAGHRESIDGFVRRARTAGRTIATGGRVEPGDGYFYRPTVILDVVPSDEVFREEVFGPVLAVTPFQSEREAIELANATDYGMACGVWSSDRDRALRVASGVDAGTCWINAYWSSPVDLSRTAWKASGVGAMDFGVEGLREYLRFKQVVPG